MGCLQFSGSKTVKCFVKSRTQSPTAFGLIFTSTVTSQRSSVPQWQCLSAVPPTPCSTWCHCLSLQDTPTSKSIAPGPGPTNSVSFLCHQMKLWLWYHVLDPRRSCFGEFVFIYFRQIIIFDLFHGISQIVFQQHADLQYPKPSFKWEVLPTCSDCSHEWTEHFVLAFSRVKNHCLELQCLISQQQVPFKAFCFFQDIVSTLTQGQDNRRKFDIYLHLRWQLVTAEHFI